MYNRYIPQPDGTYRRNMIPDPPKPPPHKPEVPIPAPCQDAVPPPPCPPPEPKPIPAPTPPCRQNLGADAFLRQLLPRNLDTGDLLIILLLLLMAGDHTEDRNTALLTLALYFFM